MGQDELRRGETIRSFHRVFENDRRLHSIPSGDRPIVLGDDGVPVRALGYATALAAAAFVLLRVPLVGELMGVVPGIVWYLVVPVMFGGVGARVERDGLALHRWLELEVRGLCTPRVRHGGHAVRPEGRAVPLCGWIVVAPDYHGPALRRARITGPGRVAFTEPVGVLERRQGRAVARPLSRLSPRTRHAATRAITIDLEPGETLEVCP